MARRHEIPATPENMVWGYLDSSSPPVLSVNSGDTVTLHSFPAGGKETLPDDLKLVPEDYMRAIETLPHGPGPHFITGPVYVRGAQAGDALQIDILDVKIRQDWGFVSILPLLGTLPDEFTVGHSLQKCDVRTASGLPPIATVVRSGLTVVAASVSLAV